MSMVATDSVVEGSDGRAARGMPIVLLQLAMLLALTFMLLRHEFVKTPALLFSESETAHGVAIPALIALLIYRRWNALNQAVGRGSVLGLLFVAAGLAMYALSSWPFNFGYPRQMAIVPIMAGCIVCVCGWRVFKLAVPMLLLLGLAIPLGARHFAALIIRPETITLDIAERILGALPGMIVHLQGPDLHFDTGAREGVIALGDPNRGASLLLASLTIAMFVSFVSIRPLWQLIVASIACGPIILFCNLLRLLVHGLLTIYGDFSAISGVPRMSAHAFALALVYVSFLGLFAVLNRLIVAPEPATEHDPRAGEMP